MQYLTVEKLYEIIGRLYVELHMIREAQKAGPAHASEPTEDVGPSPSDGGT